MSNISFIKVVPVNTNSQAEYFMYAELMEKKTFLERNEILRKWYEPRKQNLIRLECGCNHKEQIPMKITKRNDNFILSSFPNFSEKHLEGCNFHNSLSYKSNSVYESNIKEDEQGNVFVSMKSSDIKPKVSRKKGDKIDKETNIVHTNSMWDSDEESINQNYSTVFAMAKRLLIQAWDNCVFLTSTKNAPYPSIERVYLGITQYLAKKMFIRTNGSSKSEIHLKDIMYTKGKDTAFYAIGKKHDFKYNVFFMLQYAAHEQDDEDENVSYIHMRNPLDPYTPLAFSVDTKLLKRALKSNRVSDGPYIVAGFASKKNRGLPRIDNLAIIPINKYGVVIESSYERALYDELCNQERLVQRIHDTKYHPKWKGFYPDGLFIDTTPRTIIEVFGMSKSMEDYHETKRIKIDHYSSLKPHYGFWHWDAYRDAEIPSFPQKKN